MQSETLPGWAKDSQRVESSDPGAHTGGRGEGTGKLWTARGTVLEDDTGHTLVVGLYFPWINYPLDQAQQRIMG